MEKPKSFLGSGWSFPPKFEMDSSTINIVSEEEDIRQSLYLLLSTVPGERITNPTYGCDLHSMIFNPISSSTRVLMKEIIETAILDWEPRIEIEEIEINDKDEQEKGVVYISLFYTIRKINVRTNIVYPFYKNEGTDIVEVT